MGGYTACDQSDGLESSMGSNERFNAGDLSSHKLQSLPFKNQVSLPLLNCFLYHIKFE